MLGPVTVSLRGDGKLESLVSQPRPLALLTYLALARPRGLQSREAAMALLWPQHDAERARRGLRNALHELRRTLGRDAVISIGDGLVGIDPTHVDCDAYALERGSWAPDAGDDAHSVDPLHGLHVDDAAEFDRWLSAERTRLRELLREAQSKRAAADGAARQARTAPSPGAPHGGDVTAMYIRGHYCFLRAAHDGEATTLRHARTYYERALALDPDFAPAVAGLSNFYAVAARRGLLVPFEATWDQCLAYSRRTLELSDTIGIPHVHFGTDALYLRDDFDRAGAEFARAVRKDPEYAEGHRFLAVWMGIAGRSREAIEAAETAARLEPDIVTMVNTLAAVRIAAGDLVGGEEALRATLELEPRHAPSRERLLRLLERQERLAEAVEERRRAPAAFRGEQFARAWAEQGVDGYRAERRGELRDEVERIEARMHEAKPSSVNERYAPPVLRLVAAYAELGERSKVRTWRLQATASRPVLAHWFASMPELQRAPALAPPPSKGASGRPPGR
ncbi:MAG: hypothetical protein IPN16_24090 [Gemmatimonadetes bacterium]|nr:hypothetical protein [Gemmatimonadota bacterium]